MQAYPNPHGLWLIEPLWAQEMARTWAHVSREDIKAAVSRSSSGDQLPYELDSQGTAVLRIEGPLTKHLSFWALLCGGTSTTGLRRDLAQAVADDAVERILLHVDSPGGHVAGVNEAALAVKQADSQKPVHAHIDDLGASAAYWIASQARIISANPTAEVGSIGTMAVLSDLSEMAAKQGITVHVISTGPYKGAGTPGTELTPEILKDVQRRVDAINKFFLDAVQAGRNLRDEALAQVSDGRVWIASEAKRLGLIDRIQTFDSALESAPLAGQDAGQTRRNKLALRKAALLAASNS